MRTAWRYFQTVRHLRPRQLFNRIGRILVRPRIELRAAPPVRGQAAAFARPIEATPTMLSSCRFCFLNEERECCKAEDWNPRDAAALWTYNLHYFDDLNAEGANARGDWHRGILRRWVGENPPGHGVGWDPYPVSRRIVNWIKWSLAGYSLSAECTESLAVQARWLRRRLEFHLLGNHILANAKALMFAGLYFDGEESDAWYLRGQALFEKELREQILPDGAHFELSPMYHSIVLEDLLDLANLLRSYGRDVPTAWLDVIRRMRHWLAAMCHPDGEIAFFNDAAFNVAAAPWVIDAYMQRLSMFPSKEADRDLWLLESSGYVVVSAGTANLLCDCAPIGPDYQVGHAHADSLSFELSVYGQRLFVNSGTSCYGISAERSRQRGTAAHNTVVIDDRDSSEVWAGFRVARRARILRRRVSRSSSGVEIEAAHDGYRRLAGGCIHSRRWTLADSSLLIEDRVSGSFRVGHLYLHMHPEIDVIRCSGNEVELGWAGNRASVRFDGAESVEVTRCTWHPRFGESLETSRIVARMVIPEIRTSISWRRQ